MHIAEGKDVFPSHSFTLLVMQLIHYCVQALGPFNLCAPLLPPPPPAQARVTVATQLNPLSYFFPLTFTVFDKAFLAAMG